VSWWKVRNSSCDAQKYYNIALHVVFTGIVLFYKKHVKSKRKCFWTSLLFHNTGSAKYVLNWSLSNGSVLPKNPFKVTAILGPFFANLVRRSDFMCILFRFFIIWSCCEHGIYVAVGSLYYIVFLFLLPFLFALAYFPSGKWLGFYIAWNAILINAFLIGLKVYR
jgi:hypothetical protein